jgi:hypothetical protein
VFFVIGVTFVLAMTGTASAQLTGAVCDVGELGGAGNGTAVIANPGLNGSTPQLLDFAFSNTCGSGAATQGCAVGTLDQATCAANIHSGEFIYCPTSSCNLDCSPNVGIQACTPANVGVATLVAGGNDCIGGSFQGVCVGNACVGSGPSADVLYALMFDQATSEAALAQCPPDPVGAGGSLTSASFSGVIVY